MKNRRTIITKIPLWTGMLLCCLFLSCISEDDNMEKGSVNLKVGDEIPNFEVQMNNGTLISKEDLRGSCSVIVFFHTQCPDCQEEFVTLQRLYEECTYPYRMVCISRSESAADIERYWKEHQITLPYSAQEDAQIYHLFASSAIPRVYISDENCQIKSIYTDRPIATYQELLTDIKNISEQQE